MFSFHKWKITNRVETAYSNYPQQTISNHLQKMPRLAKLVNTDLSRGFNVPQVSEKHACPACCSAAEIPLSGPRLPCEIHANEERSVFHRGSSLWKYRDKPEDRTGVGPEDRTGGWTELMVVRVIGEAKRAVFLGKGFSF